MQLGVETVNNLLGIDDAFKAPDRLMELLLSDKKDALFDSFREISTDMKFDWFHEYFEDEQAERKSKKQDFTPDSVGYLLTALTRVGKNEKRDPGEYYEPAAGTGGIFIKKWWDDCLLDPATKWDSKISFLTYDPRRYWYHLEELSDRAIPFLLFNMAIRGVNGVAVQCDVLERTAKEAYFVRNDSPNYMAYSDIIKLDHTQEVADFLKIKWEKQ